MLGDRSLAKAFCKFYTGQTVHSHLWWRPLSFLGNHKAWLPKSYVKKTTFVRRNLFMIVRFDWYFRRGWLVLWKYNFQNSRSIVQSERVSLRHLYLGLHIKNYSFKPLSSKCSCFWEKLLWRGHIIFWRYALLLFM